MTAYRMTMTFCLYANSLDEARQRRREITHEIFDQDDVDNLVVDELEEESEDDTRLRMG